MAKEFNFRSQEEPFVQDPPTNDPHSMAFVLRQFERRPPVHNTEITEMIVMRRMLRHSQSQGERSCRNLSFVDDLPSTGSTNDSTLNNSVCPGDADQSKEGNQEETRENISQCPDDTVMEFDLPNKSLSPEQVREIVKDELAKMLRSPGVKNTTVGTIMNEAKTVDNEQPVNTEQIDPTEDQPPAASDYLSETPFLDFTYISPPRPDTSAKGRATEVQFDHDYIASPVPPKISQTQCETPKGPNKETPAVPAKATGAIPKNKSQQVDLRSAKKSHKDGIEVLKSLRLKKGHEKQFNALKLKYKDISSEAWELLEAMLKRPPNVTAMPKIPIKKETPDIPAERNTSHMPKILSKNQRKKAERKTIAENTSANVPTLSSEPSVEFVPPKPPEIIQISDEDEDSLFD